MERIDISYWTMSIDEVMERVQSSEEGLSSDEAKARLQRYGENSVKSKRKFSKFDVFLNQFKNPIILILFFATIVSAVTGDWFDAQIILLIILASAILSFYQEYSAGKAIEKLQEKVQFTCSVKRDGEFVDLPSNLVVPGDIVQLSNGNLIPGDGLILESEDMYVNQSTLTGESIAVEKNTNQVPLNSTLEERTNSVFMGTNVFSGNGTMVIVETGLQTQYGSIAGQLNLRPTETDFEKGVRHFGYLLSQIMLVLTITLFAINVLLNKPAIDSLLFSVALAVGITPQLLPAIVSITLSSGARKMAKKGVIVRRLNSIENFGSMDVLCTDKTGTLTEGNIKLDGAVDINGVESDEVFRFAYLNATLQKGMRNSLDEAIHAYHELNISNIQKLDEIAFDFNRRRLSVFFQEEGVLQLVTKGAFNSVLEICSSIEKDNKILSLNEQLTKQLMDLYENWSEQGIRVLGVANKKISQKTEVSLVDEQDMVFIGFLLFSDHPKADVAATIQELADRGVHLKIITGDNHLIASHTANAVGLPIEGILTGKEIQQMSEEALWQKIDKISIFAEVDPNQKERIISSLQKKSYVVGYTGDGINDVPALHAADVSISVDNAVDVAKESADIVLMEKSLKVLVDGIIEGRNTFNNTLKYILVTTSANFGNMFSVAGISLLLPFFPLLPKQILLLNFLTDFPALTISRDTVDDEMLKVPRKWDLHYIRSFMFVFGLLSSAFDYFVTFLLYGYFHESQALFQTGWFIFSIVTELVTLMIIRTMKPFYKSRPAKLMLVATVVVAIFTLIIPYSIFGTIFGLTPVPLFVIVILIGLIGLYMIALEGAKKKFNRKHPILPKK